MTVVVVTARDPEKAKLTAAELGVRALGVGLDVSDDASVRQAAAAFEREHGALDVLVNNAAAYVNRGGFFRDGEPLPW